LIGDDDIRAEVVEVDHDRHREGGSDRQDQRGATVHASNITLRVDGIFNSWRLQLEIPAKV
jgi:hypothetical protein